MRRYAFIIGATLPLIAATSASAEDVVIRIEAKRGTEAAQSTAQGWSAQFPDVVTFPLSDGWIGIALGPMPREAADARLATLKTEKKVPADSFLSPASGRELTKVAGSAPVDATGGARRCRRPWRYIARSPDPKRAAAGKTAPSQTGSPPS